MAEVKAMYPIGKTQWRKWNDDQKVAFNEARAEGVSFPDAVEMVNGMRKKVNILGILGDVVEAAAAVSGSVAAVDVAVKTVKSVTGKKKAK